LKLNNSSISGRHKERKNDATFYVFLVDIKERKNHARFLELHGMIASWGR